MRVLAGLGWLVLAVAAAAGLALASLALLAALPATRTFVASRVVRIFDEAIDGSLALEGVAVLPGGGIELRGLEVYDPDGHLVLQVGRARFFVDVTGLRTRTVGVSIELESPSVLLEEEPGGGVSIARAFEPTRRGRLEAPGGSTWTLHVTRLTVRGGELWWVDARGGTRLDASGLDLDGRGLVGPGRTRVDLGLRGSLETPVSGPIELEVVGGITGNAVRIPVLRAKVAGTALSAVAEGDLARRSGRVAVTRLGLERDVARAFAPGAPAGDDLAVSAYAESDGSVATLAVRASPAGEGARGRADAALAGRLSSPAAAVGFDAVLERLDPSRVVAAAPPGEVTLAARGAASGRSLRELHGRLTATVQRSRLRGGELRRAEIVARAERGTVEVSRVNASAPGLDVDGSLRWREGGAVSGRVTADAKDIGAALANLGALLGERLPALAGRGRVDATLGGTSAVPTAAATIDAPLLRAGELGLSGVHLSAELAGPASRASGHVEGRIATVRRGSGDLARGVLLRGALTDEEATVTATAALPGFSDPISLEARGRLGPRRETLVVSELGLAYPGARWRLSAPATVTLAGPRVDRLELLADPQRVVITGGLSDGRDLDARVELQRVDLAGLPAGLVATGHTFRGELTAALSATGTSARPELSTTFAFREGAIDGVAGLSLEGSARWSGATRRLRASVATVRAAGGTVDLDVDLPLPTAGRPAERVLLRARAREVPLEELLWAAGSDTPAAGLLALDAVVEGTVAAPSLKAGASLAGAEWRDLDGLALEIAAEDPRERLRFSVRAALDGKAGVALDAEVPLDVSDLIERPAATLRALWYAPLDGSLAIQGLELGTLSGRAGVPPRLAGVVDGTVSLSGAIAAPRAKGVVGVRGGVWGGYRDLSGRVEVTLADAAVSAKGTLAMGGGEAARFDATVRAPPEQLLSARTLRAAPLRVEVTVPGLSLAHAASTELPLTGTVNGRLTAGGTLGAPEATLALEGEDVAVEGRPLGTARLDARYGAARGSGELVLRPSGGGTLRTTFALGLDLGLGAARGAPGDAPAEVTATAEALDLGFLAALAPEVVRNAGGTLAMDLRASGRLAHLSPRGTLRVSGGRLAVTEWGEWTGIAVEANLTEDAVEVSKVEVHRGPGRVTASGSLRGLRAAGPAALNAHVISDGFVVARAGMDVAKVDLEADATGTYVGAKLAVDVRVPRAVVRLPKRAPRPLQSLEPRKDITVGKRVERKWRTRVAPAAEGSPAAAPERPFTLTARLRADRQLLVKSDDPRIDLELEADVEYERTGDEEYARGFVGVIRGTLEPIGGRNFTVERGRVQFTGGPPSAATLDFQARYDNPAAVVTVNVDGPARAPEIHFHSEPPMAEPEIAMLIATGRTDLKAGGGAVATLSGEEAGRAALGVLATQAFKNLVADKLPVDSVSVDSSAFRAGKYLTSKIYVIYSRRFEADPLRGENTDEVRVEYQVSRRWTFESRYGNAQSGGVNLIWSKEY